LLLPAASGTFAAPRYRVAVLVLVLVLVVLLVLVLSVSVTGLGSRGGKNHHPKMGSTILYTPSLGYPPA